MKREDAQRRRRKGVLHIEPSLHVLDLYHNCPPVEYQRRLKESIPVQGFVEDHGKGINTTRSLAKTSFFQETQEHV